MNPTALILCSAILMTNLLGQEVRRVLPHFEPAGGTFVARGLSTSAQIVPGGVWLTGPDGAVHLRLDGAPMSSLHGGEPTGAISNYYLGNDPALHREGVPHFARVENPQVLPGVDLEWLVAGRDLRFDLRLAAGTAPESTLLTSSDWSQLVIDGSGNLRARGAGDELVLSAPRAFQGEGAARRELACSFVLVGETAVAFTVDGADAELPLHIDPVVRWSTWIGGSGGETVRAVDTHPTGDIAVIGDTSSTDLPLLHGTGISPTTLTTFVLGFDAAGRLEFSTYFGGTDGATIAFDGGLDYNGDVLLGGSTGSSTLPVASWVLQTQPGPWYFAQLTWGLAPVPGTLAWCTYFSGGSGMTAMHVARNQSVIYAAFQWGQTYLPSAYSASVFESYVMSIGGGNQLGIATSIGFQAQVTAIHGDLNSNIIVAGLAFAGLPTTPISYQQAPNGSHSPFVFEFTGSANGFVACTYYGNDGCGPVTDIDVLAPDPMAVAGRVVITGNTTSTSLPLVNAVRTTPAPLYVARFNPFYTGLDYSTYLGHSGPVSPPRLGSDTRRRTHVAAQCSGPFDLPLVNALRGGPPSGYDDGLLVRLSPSGGQVEFSTYVSGVPASCNEMNLAVGLDGTIVLASGERGDTWFHLGATLPTPAGPSTDACVLVLSPDVLPSYGTGSLGAGFTPYLSGGGVSAPGKTIRLQVFHGLGGSIGALAFGSGPFAAPLFGGTLWITPPWATVTVLLGGSPANYYWPYGAGYASLDLAIPPVPALSGTPLFVQGAFVDPWAVASLSLTNAVNASIQ